MNTINEFLRILKKDCVALRKSKDLTEYGKGQLDLIHIIERELN